MIMERVHVIYYLYTSLVVFALVLSLGKFFCVRKLYELYDTLDEEFGFSLTATIIIGTVILLLSYLALFSGWKVGILVALLIMCICGLVFSIWLAIILCSVIYSFLHDYHLNLKYKRKL